MNYSKDDFLGMIEDWKADNAPEMDDLKIEDPEIDENTYEWTAAASDNKTTYLIKDDGRGNIVINYLGTK